VIELVGRRPEAGRLPRRPLAPEEGGRVSSARPSLAGSPSCTRRAILPTATSIPRRASSTSKGTPSARLRARAPRARRPSHAHGRDPRTPTSLPPRQQALLETARGSGPWTRRPNGHRRRPSPFMSPHRGEPVRKARRSAGHETKVVRSPCPAARLAEGRAVRPRELCLRALEKDPEDRPSRGVRPPLSKRSSSAAERRIGPRERRVRRKGWLLVAFALRGRDPRGALRSSARPAGQARRSRPCEARRVRPASPRGCGPRAPKPAPLPLCFRYYESETGTITLKANALIHMKTGEARDWTIDYGRTIELVLSRRRNESTTSRLFCTIKRLQAPSPFVSRRGAIRPRGGRRCCAWTSTRPASGATSPFQRAIVEALHVLARPVTACAHAFSSSRPSPAMRSRTTSASAGPARPVLVRSTTRSRRRSTRSSTSSLGGERPARCGSSAAFVGDMAQQTGPLPIT